MRKVGIFNVLYGLLGLISSALLAFVLPNSPMPPAMLWTGAVTAVWIILSGIALIIWGDRVTGALWRFVQRTARRIFQRPAPARE